MAALKDVMARIKPLVSPPVPTTDAETETVQVRCRDSLPRVRNSPFPGSNTLPLAHVM
jgi:hypothetical protein